MPRIAGLALPAFFLIFLVPLAAEVWHLGSAGGRITSEVWLGWVLLLSFTTVYLGAFDQLEFVPETLHPRAWWWLLALGAIAAVFGWSVKPVYVLWLLPYIPSVGCYVLPRRIAISFGIAVVVVAGCYAVILSAAPEAYWLLISVAARLC